MTLPLLAVALLCGATPTPPRFDATGHSLGAPASERVASYVLEARLDPASRTLDGTATLTWRNRSAVPQRVLWFHAYWNAFQNASSTFAREAARGTLGRGFVPTGDAEAWGWTRLRSARLPDGTDVVSTLAWERPDDGNPHDQTVFTLTLPSAVPPGGEVVLALAWTAHVPKIVARTGVQRGYFLLGQWFPKIGVLEIPPERGAITPTWNCHQFHASTEFYADFGTYDARLTVPKDLVVGATGARTLRRENADGTVTHGFHQDDVIDFAWTAYGGFVEATDTFRSDGLPEVRLTALVPKTNPAIASQLFAAAKATLEHAGRAWLPYPWPTLTLVAPPAGANSGSGGMEYPTFLAVFHRDEPAEPRDALVWETVVHELCHDWFQSLVATNEFEEPWMDEGMATWCTSEVFDAQALDIDFAQLTPAPLRSALRPFLTTALSDHDSRGGSPSRYRTPLATPGFRFRTGAEVSDATYGRAAAVLELFEHELGEDVFARAMQTYVGRWAWRHPSTDDFLSTVSEASGRDLSRLGTELFRGTAGLDDRVSELTCRAEDDRPGPGFVDGANGTPVPVKTPAPDPAHTRQRCQVLVERRGELQLPLTLRLTFEDGRTEDEAWPPGERWHRFESLRTKQEGGKVVDARIHASGPVRFDASRLDDARSLRATPAPVLGVGGWMLYTAQLVAAALGALL